MTKQIEIGGGDFHVGYTAPRYPHPKKVHRYDSATAAKVAFIHAAVKNASPTYTTPFEKVAEYHCTKGGKVLVLIRENGGYRRTELWTICADVPTFELITLHKSKRLATSQIMSVFAGMCAAERAA